MAVQPSMELIPIKEKALEIIFTSEFSKEILNESFIFVFFSFNFIITHLCEPQRPSLPKECNINNKNGFLTSDRTFQNIL